MESAEVVLMSDNLSGVREAIALSRATLRNIKQNLFWAFAYNVTLVPVAAGACIPLSASCCRRCSRRWRWRSPASASSPTRCV
jgi:P-type E1-E2 ATPase